MPLTNQDIIQAHEALVTLIKNDKDERYAIPKAAREVLADNLNLTIPVIEDFSNRHNALVRKYGKADNKGGFEIAPGSANEPAFKLERQDMLHSDSGVDKLGTVSMGDLPDSVAIDLLALLKRANMIAA